MTSMYDDVPNSGHWPGAQRRRAEQQQAAAETAAGGYMCPPVDAPSCAVKSGSNGDPNCAHCIATVAQRSTPAETMTPAADRWSRHSWIELDGDVLAVMLRIPWRTGVDSVAQLSDTFCVIKNRRGWAVLFGKIIDGDAVARWHLIPVRADELPASIRGDR